MRKTKGNTTTEHSITLTSVFDSPKIMLYPKYSLPSNICDESNEKCEKNTKKS